MKNIYSGMGKEQKEKAESIWEHYDMTFMKNEFSFCFTNPEKREKFFASLEVNKDYMGIKSMTPKEIIEK